MFVGFDIALLPAQFFAEQNRHFVDAAVSSVLPQLAINKLKSNDSPNQFSKDRKSTIWLDHNENNECHCDNLMEIDDGSYETLNGIRLKYFL